MFLLMYPHHPNDIFRSLQVLFIKINIRQFRFQRTVKICIPTIHDISVEIMLEIRITQNAKNAEIIYPKTAWEKKEHKIARKMGINICKLIHY